jgi:hypothetical protein
MMPSFYCTDACFEENSMSTVLIARQGFEGGQHWKHGQSLVIDLAPWIDGPYFEFPRPDHPEDQRRFLGTAPAHDTARLPEAYRGMKNGHSGSHQFLVDDFVRACRKEALPPCHIWNSAAWCAPGLVAHQSALKDGELLSVPDFGTPPADWPRLEFPPRRPDPRRPVLPPLSSAPA